MRVHSSSQGSMHHCRLRLLVQIPELWQPELLLVIYCSFCSLGWCDPLLGFVPFHFQASITPELQFHVVL